MRSRAGWPRAMAEALRHPGALLGVARFFHDPRGSMRGMLNSRPGEGRLFSYALAAAFILLGGRVLELLAAPAELQAELPGQIAAHAAALLIFVPLAWYALAAFGTLLARAFRGEGGWYEGRAAFFWAALVSSPVLVLSSLLPLAVPTAPGLALVIGGQIGPVFFAWALAQCYAETFGFRRASNVLAVIAALMLALIAVFWWAAI